VGPGEAPGGRGTLRGEACGGRSRSNLVRAGRREPPRVAPTCGFNGWHASCIEGSRTNRRVCVVGAIFYWILESNAEKKYQISNAGPTDKVVFSDIFKFGLSYWYIVALCITFYSAIFPFQTFAVKFFMEAHGTSRELGGFLSSMLTLFAMVATPLFGLMVDKIGKRSLFMMFGSILLVPVYLMMAYTHISLYVPMAMMGIAFSLIPGIMWPSVSYLVEEKKLGYRVWINDIDSKYWPCRI